MVVAVGAELVTNSINQYACFVKDIQREKKGEEEYLSSNSVASLRKHFLHFLQANVYPCQSHCSIFLSVSMACPCP